MGCLELILAVDMDLRVANNFFTFMRNVKDCFANMLSHLLLFFVATYICTFTTAGTYLKYVYTLYTQQEHKFHSFFEFMPFSGFLVF